MKIVGRMLTAKEAEKTRAHYKKNSGLKWDLQKIASCVVEGAEAAHKDAETRTALENGMKMCNEVSR